MRIVFLGTSAGTPTKSRNVTSQAVQFDDGRIWLLDCGEGTQHQLMRSGLRPSRIDRILLTHLHGDHCYGLPGLLSCLAINGRVDPVEVIGPPGARELIESTLRLSYSVLNYPLSIVEVDRVGEIGERDGWRIEVQAMVHRVPSFGYSLREHPRRGRFHLERAKALGVPSGPLFRRLQDGASVQLADGRLIRPDEVCDPPRPGRHLVLLGDTADAAAILSAARGCDVLVHEATYDASRVDKAIEWGHSTSTIAGRFAAAAGARALILTHFSARYDEDASGIGLLIAEAQRECPTTTVLAASDLWSYELPTGE